MNPGLDLALSYATTAVLKRAPMVKVTVVAIVLDAQPAPTRVTFRITAERSSVALAPERFARVLGLSQIREIPTSVTGRAAAGFDVRIELEDPE